MSELLKNTLVQVLTKQADRLAKELCRKHNPQQAQFLAKQCVSAVYGFDHWANMSYFIRTNDNPYEDSIFEHAFLHPKTITNTSLSFINTWEEKKDKIAHALGKSIKKSTELSFNEYYNGDECSRYLAKMYGFSSMSDIWLNIKYHFEKNGTYTSIFDLKRNEIKLILKSTPDNSRFIEEIIRNQSRIGQTLFIGPKEWFKFEMDSSSISLSEKYLSISPFYGWTTERILDLFINDIKHRFGQFITFELSKILLETIIPILVYDLNNYSIDISMDAFCEVLKLKNLLMIVGDTTYPACIQDRVQRYLKEIGYVDISNDNIVPEKIHQKHDHASMLVSSTVFNLNNYFNSNYFGLCDDVILIDAENYGAMEKHELEHKSLNFANDVIDHASYLKESSMILIYDTNANPSSEYQIESIIKYCRIKSFAFVLLTDNPDKYDLQSSAVIDNDGELSCLSLNFR